MEDIQKIEHQRIAAKAIIYNDQGHVLILKEAATYDEGVRVDMYGVPGGRVEVGETFYDALMREVNEETQLTVEPVQLLTLDEWRPIIRDIPTQIIGIFVLCRLVREAHIVLNEEHDAYVWTDTKTVDEYPMKQEDKRAIKMYYQQPVL